MPKAKVNVADEIKKIMASILEIEPDKITPEAKFVEDLGMDSMMALEIVAAIEKKFKIVIPEEKLSMITSMQDVISITEEGLESK